MTCAEVFDAAILIWLIGTWFWEGHHKKCTVLVECAQCKRSSETDGHASTSSSESKSIDVHDACMSDVGSDNES